MGPCQRKGREENRTNGQLKEAREGNGKRERNNEWHKQLKTTALRDNEQPCTSGKELPTTTLAFVLRSLRQQHWTGLWRAKFWSNIPPMLTLGDLWALTT